MSYQINIVQEAREEVSKLSGYIRAQARQIFHNLATNPRPPKAKELRGKPGYYRVWLEKRWRIVYSIDDELKMVTILRVRRKEQIDYAGI